MRVKIEINSEIAIMLKTFLLIFEDMSAEEQDRFVDYLENHGRTKTEIDRDTTRGISGLRTED